MTTDDPTLDGTDYAHPAWWRGCDHGVRQAVGVLERVLAGDDAGAGAVADAGLEHVRRAVLALRKERP